MASPGDVDISAVARVLADAGRSRMLFAVSDGRALPASRLAAEAGVSPATASSHLKRLTAAGLMTVRQHGRHRYYRLASADVARLIETMAALAPAAPVRSLREDTRGRALREARTCYDHLAGRLGVAIMRGLLDRGHIVGGDGTFDVAVARSDRLSAYGRDVDYRLSPTGAEFLTAFGAALPPRRPVIRYCVDWSEQAHHLAGGVGHGLLERMLALEWIARRPDSRAIAVTDAGRAGLTATFGLSFDVDIA